jgi:hypothetical protein
MRFSGMNIKNNLIEIAEIIDHTVHDRFTVPSRIYEQTNVSAPTLCSIH